MKVWAESMTALFVQAALGMNSLSGMRLAAGPRVSRALQHAAADEESLLVAFLSELVYLHDQEGLGFDEFQVDLQPPQMHVQMWGSPVISIEKPIKAVTFHYLKILRSARGCETEIVFDV